MQQDSNTLAVLDNLNYYIKSGLPLMLGEEWEEQFNAVINPTKDLQRKLWEFLNWLLTDSDINPGIQHSSVKDIIATCASMCLDKMNGQDVEPQMVDTVRVSIRAAYNYIDGDKKRADIAVDCADRETSISLDPRMVEIAIMRARTKALSAIDYAHAARVSIDVAKAVCDAIAPTLLIYSTYEAQAFQDAISAITDDQYTAALEYIDSSKAQTARASSTSSLIKISEKLLMILSTPGGSQGR